MKKHLSWIIISVLFLAVTFWGGAQVYFAKREESDLKPAQGQALPAAASKAPGKYTQRAYHYRQRTSPGESAQKGPAQKEQRNAPDNLGYVSVYGKLPESLQGSDVWGGLQADEKGNLIIDRDVRDVFDFFMSGVGEEPREVVLGRAREYIRHKLDKDAALQADKILDDYLAYKDYLARTHRYDRLRDPNLVRNKQALAAAINEMFQSQVEERRRFLGKEVADAFFAGDEANDRKSISAFEGNAGHD